MTKKLSNNFEAFAVYFFAPSLFIQQTDMRWESLISIHNLKLAWRRINTARNLQYKRFFRESFLVYESSLADNIRDLHQTLAAGVWEPSHATRLYLPKPSGLQRPLTLLEIEDQILLQAVSNLFAKQLHAKRKKIELETVFSNKLAERSDSIFFTERWQTTYNAFQKKCTDLYDAGYRWAADFDLAAYYDTISHDLLLSIVSPKNNHPYTKDIIRQWLQIWSADNISNMTGHGIPQGPIASDFLAEAFFLPVDLLMKKGAFQYLRYVDDIRLFGRSENEVRRAAILLEQECRHRGLIPQSAKFKVRELKSKHEAMGALPSIPPTTGANSPSMDVLTARFYLESSIDGRPLKVEDKARFRYVMYRAPADTTILDRVLLLMSRHPEHIDAFVAYFSNFSKRRKIARVALNYLASDLPYSYVRGELWHIVALQAGTSELQAGLNLARADAKSRKSCVSLSWGVMHFLIRCEQEGLCRLGRRLSSENPLSRALLAPIFPAREFTSKGLVVTCLKGTLLEQLAGARQLQHRKISLNSIGLRQQQLKPICRNTLHSLGVIKKSTKQVKTDWIAKTLNELYGCNRKLIWHSLLGTEYEHALQTLVETKVRYPSAYSDWLSLQDSFNDITVRKLFEFLKTKGLTGHSKTVGKDGALVSYGKLLAIGDPFDTTYPDIASRLRDIHYRRNKIPGSHPYDLKGGSQNKWLKRRERNSLAAKQRVAINEICDLVEPYC